MLHAFCTCALLSHRKLTVDVDRSVGAQGLAKLFVSRLQGAQAKREAGTLAGLVRQGNVELERERTEAARRHERMAAHMAEDRGKLRYLACACAALAMRTQH